jgi:ATP-dependent DNA helicase PIF1
MNTNLSLEKLSLEQNIALSKFKQGKNIFITGPGGTGKTKLISHFVEYTNLQRKNCQVCALTGCAAILLGNAKTIHSWSGIKLAKESKEKVIASVLKNPRAVSKWKTVDVLIIDEVSMMSKKIFDIIEELGRIIRKNKNPFGGIQVIFSGDFYQLPPVGSIMEIETSQFCFESEKWYTVFTIENHIILKTIFRQKDPLYKKILMEIREGKLSEENIQILKKYINREKPVDYDPIKLFAIRSKVDSINNEMFHKLEEKEYKIEFLKKTNCKTYMNCSSTNPMNMTFPDDVMDKCNHLSSAEIEYEINNLINNTPCIQLLSLKKGASVMCTVNYDMDQGICNGLQGKIIDVIESTNTKNDPIPVIQFINGKIIQMQKHIWQSDEYPSIYISQYPICLSWALSIHKIQGTTLKQAEMDIGKSIFEYGQTYVALSRIESLDGLYLSAFFPQKIKTNPRVIQFYKDIIDNQEELKEQEQVEYEEEKNKKNELELSSSIDFKKFIYTSNEI